MPKLCCIRTLLLLPCLLGAFSVPAVQAQEIGLPHQTWSAEVIRSHGQPVIPLFDGWYPNADGSRTLCFSFFNMNREQALDVAAGADNYLETDYPGLDLEAVLLPTHFDPLPPAYRHVFCAFTVRVPADFSTGHRITWHLASNGQRLSVPGKVIAPYVLDEPRSDGRGDIAPLVRLGEDGPAGRGRTGLHAAQVVHARAGEAVSLSAGIEHPDAEVWVGWALHSGPGKVSFSNKEYMTASGDTTTTEAIFHQPGNYIVRMQSIDDIAAFEFYCCHTNAYFHVNVSN